VGGKSTSTSAPRLNQLSIQTSTLGLPLTLGWGRGRVKCNLIWYDAFTAIPHVEKQGGGKGLSGGSKNTTYTYTASFILAIGEGGATGIGGINTVWKDNAVFTGAGALAAAGLSLATGTPTQATWGYLASRFPSQASNYSGIAYVYAQDYQLGDAGSLPNHSFEVDFAIQLGGGVHDADPKDIVTDFLTNSAYGVPGWPSGMLGDLSDWSAYCRANNLLLSPVLESQSTASSIMEEWFAATNSAPFWSEGMLKVRPYGDAAATGNGVTWTPNLTPAYDLTESDLLPFDEGGPPVSIAINDQSDAYNIVQVEFLDRANSYNVGIAVAQDLANIIEFGPRRQDPATMHSICDAAIARKAAELLLGRTLYIREDANFRLPWNFVLLEPTDLVTLTTTTDELQLFRLLVRVKEITEEDGAEGKLTIVAEVLEVGTASAAQYSAHSGTAFAPNTEVAPGSVSTPTIFDGPTDLTGFDREIWLAAASTSPPWGGCEVWISADGTTYSRIGVVDGPARYGVTTASLASHADPDNANTLSVNLATSRGTLIGGSSADADAAATLAWLGGELIAYRDAALTSANHYDLTHLRRGLHGTAPAAHSSGASFVRLDDAIFKFAYGDLNAGDTIYVKLPSFNQFGRGLEDLSAVTAYSFTLGSGSSRFEDVVDDLATISSDSILSKGSEKQKAIIDWTALESQYNALIAKYHALGDPSALTTVANTATTEISALATYLGSLSPTWSDVSQDTAIAPATWTAKWNSAYQAVADFNAAITGQPGADGAPGAPGAPGISALKMTALPNPIAVPCTAGGTPKAGIPSFDISASQAGSDVTGSLSYGTITSSNMTGVSRSGNTVSASGMTADTGTITVPGSAGGSSDSITVAFSKVKDGPAFVADSATVGDPGSTSYVPCGSVTLLMGPGGNIEVDSNGTFGKGSGGGTIDFNAYIEYSVNGGGYTTLGSVSSTPGVGAFSSGDWSYTGSVSGATLGLTSRVPVTFRIQGKRVGTSYLSFGGTLNVAWQG